MMGGNAFSVAPNTNQCLGAGVFLLLGQRVVESGEVQLKYVIWFLPDGSGQAHGGQVVLRFG